MKHFYIITNKTKDKSLEVTHKIKSYLEKQGKYCFLAKETKEIPADLDCILVLGGDGTLIRAARELYTKKVPLLGINMGTLGYLTEVEVSNLESSLNQLIGGEIHIEERMMLKGNVRDEEKDVALNDIILTRAGTLRIIEFSIYVNGELLNTYRADGVIISTPTGSTAYNLSAGGPIIEPTADMILITPICSHALHARSIVLSAKDTIEIEIGKGRDDGMEKASVSFDGEHHCDVFTGDRIVIQKAEEKTRLLKLSKVSFLETLREKMKGN